jgi:hypothetical protein
VERDFGPAFTPMQSSSPPWSHSLREQNALRKVALSLDAFRKIASSAKWRPQPLAPTGAVFMGYSRTSYSNTTPSGSFS